MPTFCPSPPSLSWPTDSVIPGTDFLVRHALGRGGMGRVFAVEHRTVGCWFAVKVLNRELGDRADMVERLKLEARALGQLSPHENLVQVIDLRASADGRWFMQMELLRGRTLYEVFSLDESCLAPVRAIRITQGVLCALDAAHHHELRLVHRDVKPSNIFLTKSSDGREIPKLLDFGVAKALQDVPGQVQTAPGLTLGTAKYICPETLEGARPDARADIYSTGIVLYEMLVGRTPFPNLPNWQELAGVILQGLPEAAYTAVPVAFRDVIRRATARTRAARYPTARAFSQDLAQVLAHLESARPSSDRESAPPVSSRPLGSVGIAPLEATTSFSFHTPTKPGAAPTSGGLEPDRDEQPTDVALPLFLVPPPSPVVPRLRHPLVASDDDVYLDMSREHELLANGTIAVVDSPRFLPDRRPWLAGRQRSNRVFSGRSVMSTNELLFRTAATPPPRTRSEAGETAQSLADPTKTLRRSRRLASLVAALVFGLLFVGLVAKRLLVSRPPVPASFSSPLPLRTSLQLVLRSGKLKALEELRRQQELGRQKTRPRSLSFKREWNQRKPAVRRCLA